ncbi:MAG: gamma carbonic anhydrase family protein [Ignavibacteriae bacterium]|nr:gamma carbonic anhydrase family protein [Ignavibacteriota bacterium]
MPLITYNGALPSVDPSVFVADGVHLIGDVHLAKDVSIWFNSVLRGDINRIDVGERTNIQDCTVIHVTHELAVRIGSDVTVGHRAIIHGCTIGDCSLIGMGAVILDNATVGSAALVAAGAVVLQNFVVPDGMLAAGVPAKIIRPLTDDEKRQIKESAFHYAEYARGYMPAAGDRS